jgi:hypothetical protein
MGYRFRSKQFQSTQVSTWFPNATRTRLRKFFSPSDIANLALWLDAADGTTITESGGFVSQWNDKSGNGRNFAQATGANQPAFTANGLNGWSVITFDGTNDRLQASVTTGSSTATVSAIWQANNSTNVSNSNARIFDIKTGSGGLQLLRDSGAPAIHTKSSLWQTLLTSSRWFNQTTAVQLSNIAFDSASTSFRQNGSDLSAQASPAAVGEAGTLCMLGARADVNSSTFLNGYIAEVIVVNGVQSTSDRELVEGYLAWKWGLQGNLPAGHPYKNARP